MESRKSSSKKGAQEPDLDGTQIPQPSRGLSAELAAGQIPASGPPGFFLGSSWVLLGFFLGPAGALPGASGRATGRPLHSAGSSGPVSPLILHLFVRRILLLRPLLLLPLHLLLQHLLRPLLQPLILPPGLLGSDRVHVTHPLQLRLLKLGQRAKVVVRVGADLHVLVGLARALAAAVAVFARVRLRHTFLIKLINMRNN